MRASTHVLVVAKAPIPGRCKTRLSPPLSPPDAARVAGAALADTLTAVAACGADRKVLALDGRPGDWLPPGFEVVAQRPGLLDRRLAGAWADTWAGGSTTGLQVGMDTPQVTPSELDELLALLGDEHTALLGPALDGGWWVIGLPPTDPQRVFAGIPMSTRRTGRAQAERLRRLGFRVIDAPARRDIDTVSDLAEVTAGIPASATARCWRSIGTGAPAAATASGEVVVRDDHGAVVALDTPRWYGKVTGSDHHVLALARGPVLDVGCGPGRIVGALARRGVVALGIDAAPSAVGLARAGGAPALWRSVFDRLPGEGRWASVLLLDGNIGIGGDPVRLLGRCRRLLAPGGLLMTEVHPPGTGWRTCRARVERDGEHSAWFSWAVVGADAIWELAGQSRLAVTGMTAGGDGRWFAHLSHGTAPPVLSSEDLPLREAGAGRARP